MKPNVFEERKSSTSIEMLTLKNGATEAKPIVITTMMNLKALMQSNPIAFYELVEKCRNTEHQMFGNTQEAAEKLALMQNGVVHSSVRNIVLSAAQGEDLNLTLGNPVAPNSQAVNPGM